MAWFIAARCVLSCPASWLGSACSAMVEYDLMSLIRTVTFDPLGPPMPPLFLAELGGQAARAAAGIASRPALPGQRWPGGAYAAAAARSGCPADTPSDSLTKTASHLVRDRLGRERARTAAIALIVLPSATRPEQFLFGGREVLRPDTGGDQRLHDGWVQGGAAGGHRANGVHQLAALGDVVLEQVAVSGRTLGQQRDRVLGLVVLGQHHDPGAWVTLAHLTGGVDALAVELGRHPYSVTITWGWVACGAADELVVVGGYPHDMEGRGVGVDEARTPSRTIRLSSARKTLIGPGKPLSCDPYTQLSPIRPWSEPESRHASVRWW